LGEETRPYGVWPLNFALGEGTAPTGFGH